MGSQVFGNLIAAFVLGNFPQVIYVLVMVGIMLLAVFILFCLRTPIKTADSHVEEEGQPATILAALKKIWQLLSSGRFLAIVP